MVNTLHMLIFSPYLCLSELQVVPSLLPPNKCRIIMHLWNYLLGVLQYLILAAPFYKGLFCHIQYALQCTGCITLILSIHVKIDDWCQHIASLSQLPMHMLGVILLATTWFGDTYASFTKVGDVFQVLDRIQYVCLSPIPPPLTFPPEFYHGITMVEITTSTSFIWPLTTYISLSLLPLTTPTWTFPSAEITFPPFHGSISIQNAPASLLPVSSLLLCSHHITCATSLLPRANSGMDDATFCRWDLPDPSFLHFLNLNFPQASSC